MIALVVAAAGLTPADEFVRDYMYCVRRNSARLEPSGDPPEDIAKAAIMMCNHEESAAFNSSSGSTPEHLRETAVFYGSGQVVVTRLCRRTRECGFLPLPK
jgi:hypothetical protein